MTLPNLAESDIETLLDSATLTLLSKWHEMAPQLGGEDIPIVVASRHLSDDPHIRNAVGTMNSSSFARLDGILSLVVWLEFPPKQKLEMRLDDLNAWLSHEVAHRIVSLKGFGELLPPSRNERTTYAFIVNLAHHCAIYTLQDSVQQEWKAVVDGRLDDQVTHLMRHGMAGDDEGRLRQAILLADDLLHCSDARAAAAWRILGGNAVLAALVKKVLALTEGYDLTRPDGNLELQMSIAKELGVSEAPLCIGGIERLRVEIEALPMQERG